MLRDRNWAELKSWAVQIGSPGLLPFNWSLSFFPNIVLAHRILILVCIYATALLVYRIAIRLGKTTPQESLLLAVLVAIYPAFQVHVELVMTTNTICLLLFLLATYLAIVAESKRGFSHAIMRVGALFLFLYSFHVKSLCVFYAAAFLCIFIAYSAGKDPAFFRLAARFIMNRFDYVLCPFVFWVISQKFFRPHGLYEGYNAIHFDPLTVFYTTRYSFVVGVRNVLARARLYVGIVEAVGFFLIGWYFFAMKEPKPEKSTWVRSGILVAISSFWILLAIVPYAVTNKAVESEGFSTRHALLLGIPCALLLTSVLIPLFQSQFRFLRALGFGMAALWIVAFTKIQIETYFQWQGRWARDLSILEQLKNEARLSELSIISIQDAMPVLFGETYRSYEWASLFKSVTGKETIAPLLPGKSAINPELLSTMYSMGDVDLNGCRGVLRIVPGPEFTDYTTLGKRYLSLALSDEKGRNKLVSGVSKMSIQYLPCEKKIATNKTQR